MGERKVCKMLKDAIADEKKAHEFYHNLIAETPIDQQDTLNDVKEIMDDEFDHRQKLRHLQEQHCGRPY